MSPILIDAAHDRSAICRNVLLHPFPAMPAVVVTTPAPPTTCVHQVDDSHFTLYVKKVPSGSGSDIRLTFRREPLFLPL